MPIRVVVPVLPTAPVQQRKVTFAPAPFDAPLGLVDNGKGMAEDILRATAIALGNEGFPSEYALQKKPSASRAMTLERRAELLARARMVISGVGD